MISKKELQYVENWANKIPMPGYDYSIEILKEIKKSFELFQEKYKDKEYSFIFSNSEEIEFEILSKNLCHMLGIDYKNIMGDYFKLYRQEAFGSDETLSSYELVEAIIENMENVANLDNDPNNKAKAVNYYKSAVKCAILRRLSDFEKFNFGAINYIGNNENLDYDNYKYLFIPSNESITPYFMMGIMKGLENDKYFVKTLLAPTNPKDYFKNQEVIIPTQILISTDYDLNKVIATPEEKIQLLTMYAKIINTYNIPNKINIYGDYEATLNDMTNIKSLSKK